MSETSNSDVLNLLLVIVLVYTVIFGIVIVGLDIKTERYCKRELPNATTWQDSILVAGSHHACFKYLKR